MNSTLTLVVELAYAPGWLVEGMALPKYKFQVGVEVSPRKAQVMITWVDPLPATLGLPLSRPRAFDEAIKVAVNKVLNLPNASYNASRRLHEGQ